MKAKKRVTIDEVALAAGVHRSTVSRVLSGYLGVNADKRRRVLKAVRAMNYHPDSLAGALKSKKRNTWGFLSSWYTEINSADHFYASTLVGFLGAADRHGMRVLLQNVLGRFDQAEACLRFCNDSQLGALAVMAPRTQEAGLRGLKRLHVPVLLLAYRPQDPQLSFVDLDNVAGAERVMGHLLERGHRRIAYIGGELEFSSNARDRLQGYRQALQTAGLAPDAGWVHNESFEPAFAVRVLGQLLALPASRRPSAVFCATDAMARALLDAALQRGLKVPADLAVAGFDDNPGANLRGPGLTTVRFPFAEAGLRAGEILGRMAEGSLKGPQRVLIEPSLVIRQST